MENDLKGFVLKQSEVKVEDSLKLKQCDQGGAEFLKLKFKDEEDRKDDLKPQMPWKEEESDRKGTIKSDCDDDKSASKQAETEGLPSQPLTPGLEDDDDIDVNDFPIGHVEPPFGNDERLLEDNEQMQVDSESITEGRHFEGDAEDLQIHPIIVQVKEELQDDVSILSPRPAKQQRLEFDGVLLPSPAEIRRRWALEADPTRANSLDEVEAMNEQVKSWRNPKMKKQEDLVMDAGVTSRRLLAGGIQFLDLELEADLKDIMVSRKFMAMRFGGSAQETFPRISKANFEKHGFDNFMYCNTDAHPMAPEIPGAGGLFFNPDHIDDFTGIQYRLFARIQRTPKALWTYVGEYEAFESQSLSKAEWNEQTNRVKSTWANMILKKDWGTLVRVRIFTRKKHNIRTPTKEQLKKVWDTGEYKGQVTAGEIQKAFDCGEEVLHVWALKCIGFDKSLQRRINEELKTWDSSEASRKTNKKKVVRGVKRKRDEYGSEEGEDLKEKDEEEADLELEDEDDQENNQEVDLEAELRYPSRGTRSRPIDIS